MHRAAARIVLLAALVAACGSPAPTAPRDQAGSTQAPAPVSATDSDARFTLRLDLSKAGYTAGERIEGLATLSVEPGPAVPVTGTDTPLTFGFKEVGGTRAMGPGSRLPCVRYVLSAADPITSPIRTSGGWSDDEPDAEFYRGFFTQPLLTLPAGDWDITAYADIAEGDDCGGVPHQLAATARVHVTD